MRMLKVEILISKKIEEICACECYTSAPKSLTPCSAIGTYFSSTLTRSITLSTWERRLGSLWLGDHLWMTQPSIPLSGTQFCHPDLPPSCLIFSSGQITSIRRPRFIASYTWLGSIIWKKMSSFNHLKNYDVYVRTVFSEVGNVSIMHWKPDYYAKLCDEMSNFSL